MAPRETQNNAYAKFWGDKQRALWYVTVFLEWSILLFLSPDFLCHVQGSEIYRDVYKQIGFG